MSYTPFKMKGAPTHYGTKSHAKMLGDLNKDGKMSGWEKARQEKIEANSGAKYASPTKVAQGSDQEKKVEDNREYVNSKTREVSSAGMERLKRNKPDASNKLAMKRWQAAYDKEFAKFKAKKTGK